MPQYHWYATDQHGGEFEGVRWATHEAALGQELASHGFTLTQAIQKPLLPTGVRWSGVQAIALFEHLHRLVSVGVLLEPALLVLARHGPRARRIVAAELQCCVGQGCSLADTMALFPDIFDSLTVTMVRSGHDSGALADVLARVVRLLQLRSELRNKVLNALYVPLMTIGFFVLIVLVIFVAIVPSLESVVAMAGQKAPASLQRLFAINHGLHSLGLMGLLGGSLAVVLLCWAIAKSTWWRVLRNWLVTHMPGVASVYCAVQMSYFFQAVSVLMQGGLSLSAALAGAQTVTDNPYIRKKLEVLESFVLQGENLSRAYELAFAQDASLDVIALLDVGHEAAALAAMVGHVGTYYFDRAQAQLRWFVMVLQPAVMIVIGLLVAALMYAVYTPIMQLPELVGTL